MFSYDKGIKLNGSSLWLDARRIVETCCVSHGHMDHAKRHRMVIATPKTLRILHERIGKVRSIPLDFHQPYDFDGCRITLYPAGHILGSAQILIEANGLRLLYSGDFNLANCLTAEPIDIPESDFLIMECTFGQPRYRFPQRSVVENMLIDFVRATLEQGRVPVVLGYALGKAQSAMKILGAAGFKMAVHGSIAKLARVYEEFGVDFGSWNTFKKDDIAGKVLVFPRVALKGRILNRIADRCTVFLSGWAVNRGLAPRYGVDLVLPLSDHADFDGLLQYARRVNARRIFTTHGFAEFPHYLRQLGFDAQPLSATTQLSLI